MAKNPLLIVLGPTASGKTKLAVSVAAALNGEIISADSRQVFKGMDIGTGKDLNEYRINGNFIPYHLIDHKEPGMRYQVNAFKEDFYEVFESLTVRHKLPVLCGGTGMYIHTLLQNYEYTAIPVSETLRQKLMPYELSALQAILKAYPPSLWLHADQSTHKRLIRAIEIAEYLKHNSLNPLPRIDFEPLIIGLTSGVESRRARIRERLEQRLQGGLIEEVQQLLAKGVSKEMLVFYGLEYKFVIAFLSGELNYQDFKERLFTAICQFAKRQMTFFRKMEKDGIAIHWFDIDRDSAIEIKVIDLYEKNFL